MGLHSTDLDFGADAGRFDFGALAVQRGQGGDLLFVPDFFQFQLRAPPIESLFEGELKGLHRLATERLRRERVHPRGQLL